ncbi:MAG: lipoate--protein ligase family protein [Chitinophagales bacterium]
MKIIKLTSNHPFQNLATEDWAIRNLDTSDSDYLLLYTNTPSVVVGRNQNIYEEVNLEYCKKNNINICRRVSGGGTVFHDMGNLNWCFITSFDGKKVNQYEYFAKPIIAVLKKLGLHAHLDERNAIRVDKLKVSGQAQFTNRKNILSHGTLLINSTLDFMQKAIEIDRNTIIKSKAAKSVRSQVANLSTLLNREIANQEIIQLLSIDKDQHKLSEEEKIAINEIQKKV